MLHSQRWLWYANELLCGKEKKRLSISCQARVPACAVANRDLFISWRKNSHFATQISTNTTYRIPPTLHARQVYNGESLPAYFISVLGVVVVLA